jgi:hypothetical protein
MKFKTLLVVLITVCVFLSVSDLSAQKHGGKRFKNAISINPISLVWNQLVVTYEHQTAKYNTFTVQGLFWFPGSGWSAYGISGSYRWYIMNLFQDKKIPIQGFSVGPTAGIMNYGWDGEGIFSDYGGISIVVGGEACYKWIFNEFVVEPKFQVLINVTSVDGDPNWAPFTIGCNVGYAW